MKKNFIVILLVLICGILFGCGKKNNIQNNIIVPTEKIYYYFTDNGKTLHLSGIKPKNKYYNEGQDDYIKYRSKNITNVECEDGFVDVINNLKKVIIDNDIYPIKCSHFFSCYKNIERIENMSKLHTDFSTEFTSMFDGCEKLQQIDLRHFVTSKAWSMQYMFFLCKNLKELDISSFDFSSVTYAYTMFGSCMNLKTIYSNKDIINNDSIYTKIFFNCNELVGGNGTKFKDEYNYAYNMGYQEKSYAASMACIDRVDKKGYFTYIPSRYQWKNGCYYIDGVKQINNWIVDGEDMYYVGFDGKMLKNSIIDGKYLNNEGKVVDLDEDMLISLKSREIKPDAWYVTNNGIWYYFENDRTTTKKGWFTDNRDDQTYYFDSTTGIMAVGWTNVDGDMYYFNELNGTEPNWYEVGDGIYESYGKKVKAYGSMYRNEKTPDGKRVDKDGKLILN